MIFGWAAYLIVIKFVTVNVAEPISEEAADLVVRVSNDSTMSGRGKALTERETG